jgi:hypothetical protein
MRIYDYRIGRFKSVDPLFQQYPWNSVYAFAENDVIRCVDLDGQESYHYTRVTDNSGKTVKLVHTHTTDIYKLNWKKTWENIKNGNFKAVYDKNPYKEYVVWQPTSTVIVAKNTPKRIEYDESQTFSSYNQASNSTDEDFKATTQDVHWIMINSLNAAADAQRESGGGYNAPKYSSLNWTAVVPKKGKYAGQSREDHVRLHNVDNKNKPDHGVFNGDGVNVTKSAWVKAQNLGLKPDANGMLVVPYQNAGKSGGANGDGSALNNVTIIVQPKTTNIITSYPSK